MFHYVSSDDYRTIASISKSSHYRAQEITRLKSSNSDLLKLDCFQADILITFTFNLDYAVPLPREREDCMMNFAKIYLSICSI